jgi:very-short-patch-repair endonuclease
MGGKRRTNQEFIEECIAKHGDRYDYSEVKFTGVDNKVTVICREHGRFEQRADYHMSGGNCKKCADKKLTKTTEQFIEECIVKHGDKYDYSLVKYVDRGSLVSIICPDHGVFLQTPTCHLLSRGCSLCNRVSPRFHTLEEFIERAVTKHGDRYDYSQADYKGVANKITIICREHGPFQQLPGNHTRGVGCTMCNGGVSDTQEQFLSKAKATHGDLYDYSLVNYINCTTKVEIICKKHGVFSQSPYKHLDGRGCKSCQNKSEGKVKMFLEESGFDFIHDRQWKDVLGRRRPDFLSHDLKLALEYDGEGHFHQIAERKSPEEQCLIDTVKTIKMMREGYSVIRLSYLFLLRENWKSILLPSIRLYDKPVCIFTSDQSLYDDHKDLYRKYNTDISNQELDHLLL